jgi:CheY-like chemotaxis protein/signal transduction histidine kinase
MPTTSAVDEKEFRRILSKNITLPLAVGVASAILFIVLIVYLLSALKWVEHTETVIGKANEISKLTVDMQTGLRGYLITGKDEFLTPYRLAKPKLAAEIISLKHVVSDNPPQVERLQRVQSMMADWDIYARAVITMRQKNEGYEQVVRDRGMSEFNEIRTELDNFQELEKSLLHERNDTAKFTTAISVSIYLIVTIFFTALLSIMGRRELIKLSTSYTANLEERQKHATQLEQQAWARAGQAQLAEKSIGQVALPLLGRTVLDFLSAYLDAAVAVIYVREKSGALKRIANYGGGREDDKLEESFEGTESLVGQAAFSNRLIHLENVPQNYIKINSGLGYGAPTNLVILPTTNNGKVNGVVEIGFLHAPSQRDIDFLTLISSNVGDNIEAALYRVRLQDVLEETQQLNEELQVQQEELRSSNEELEEQSRVLEESQALLENQKAELEQTNEKLLDQALLLDQKNTALNAAQLNLEERAQELQRASKYKSEFLANMSHELRTPLNSSMILAKLLAENAKGNLNDEQIQFAQSIYSAGNDLLDLINDILDIAKVEAGKLDLAPENIPLQRIITSLRMTFEPLAANKQLEFSTKIAPDVPDAIFTDHQRLEQILKNLMSNAIKFTDAGHIHLSITNGSAGTIAFSIIDSGIGIAPEQQSIIFEAFQQADGSISRRFGGTGLGLSISRDLAALLGGSISVKSTPDVGSTFTLVVPLEIPTAEAAPVSQPVVLTQAAKPNDNHHPVPPLSKLKFADDRNSESSNKTRSVLVIEDDPDFASILYNLAHELKYRCLVAQTATEGLELANEVMPDAILLDLGLPDSTGLAVLQKLKSNPFTRHIPVHIVSADERTEAALQLGAIGYAIKPTTYERLKQVFEKLESKLTQKVKRVLLVEDDARQRESVVQLIGDNDIEITAVESGEEAIKLLHSTIFDCMIIDLKLPDMQGHELLQRMSSEEICSFPPVIVYTGRNLTRDEESNLLKYSRSIIIKGARSPERLLDEVTLFLHKVESTLSSERQSMLKTVRSRDRALEGRKILLVDDDMRNIFALTGALEQKGAVVEIARNGVEAINKLNEIPEIDLVLMDVMMPVMDGLEATRRIRADARFQKLPIISITAKAMKDDQEQCLKAGASDYLAKPIDIDRLYSLLRVWMPTLERFND